MSYFISSSSLSLTWIEPIVSDDVTITHYRVFYSQISGPYGPISIGSNAKRSNERVKEFALDFTTTTGVVTNLNGSVTYRIQVSAVASYNGLELIGDRSNAVMVTTAEGGTHIVAVATLFRNLSHEQIIM